MERRRFGHHGSDFIVFGNDGGGSGFYEAWNDTDSADRPSMMTLNKSVISNVADGTQTQTFTFQFTTEVSAQEVKDES
jgi:hypothetical protein